MSKATPRNGDRVGIKDGWIRDVSDLDRSTCADIAGTALGAPVFVEQEWLPVKWDEEDDPTFFKLAGIRILPREKEASDGEQAQDPAQVLRAEAPVRKSR